MNKATTPNHTPENAAPAHHSARERQREGEAKALAVLAENGAAPEREDKEPEPDSFPHNGGRFEVSSEGVRFVDGSGTATAVCGELRVMASTRDVQGNRWGLQLAWRDPDGLAHREVMLNETLQGEPTEAARFLHSRGLPVMHKRKLLEYLLAAKPKARVRYVQRAGWHGDSYCTPEETFSAAVSERVCLEDAAALGSGYGRKGDAASWRERVAQPASGNTRLVFAISSGFAAPLLERAGIESGGFHFVGESSAGKTTALWAAASPWGHPERYVRTWRATANGLEAIAAHHNDGLLILDELSQYDPKQAGEAAYMLANGSAKARMSKSITLRPALTWRVLFLSSGELTLSTHMEGAGKRANAGQELRLVNIPADAGAGLGMFEELHELESASAFANALKAACAAHHGEAGRTFLRRLLEDCAEAGDAMARDVDSFVGDVVPQGASGQVVRVARRFGLVAAAGELATQYGVTGWGPGEADRCAAACFRAWVEGFGTGTHEDRAAVDAVLGFIERYGSSRFERMDGTGPSAVNRAGFWEDENGIRLYHFLPAAFKEVVAGCDPKRAAQILLSKGLLRRGDKLQRQERLPGLGKQRVYTVAIAGGEQL